MQELATLPLIERLEQGEKFHLDAAKKIRSILDKINKNPEVLETIEELHNIGYGGML